MLNEVGVEHILGNILDIHGRSESNDTDCIRSGQAKYLADVLKQSVAKLRERAAKLNPDGDAMGTWVEFTLTDMEYKEDASQVAARMVREVTQWPN